MRGIPLCLTDVDLGIPNCPQHVLLPELPSRHALERRGHFVQRFSEIPGIAISYCKCQEKPLSVGKVRIHVKELMHFCACSVGAPPLADGALSMFAVERNGLCVKGIGVRQGYLLSAI